MSTRKKPVEDQDRGAARERDLDALRVLVARPQSGGADLKALREKINARFPRTIARLAK